MNIQFSKSVYVLTIIVFCLLFVNCPVFAARSNGEVILAKDLAVGEIVTVQIATGTNTDAMVVKEGDCPRLVLLVNRGSNIAYKSAGASYSDRAYDLSDLKTYINSYTTGHGEYIFNISAPFLHDVVGKGINTGELIDAKLTIGGSFWTRTPAPSTSFFYMCGACEGSINYCATSNASGGVRPAFNLKSDTILKYNSATIKYSVTSFTEDKALAFFKEKNFDAIVYVPQGQAPTGYTALTGYTGIYYIQINDRFFFVYAQEYTPPASIGSLNITE